MLLKHLVRRLAAPEFLKLFLLVIIMLAVKISTGMTLAELLVTMSIVAVAAAIGFPSYRYVITSNYLSKTASDLQGSIELARSHALKTGLPTIVCPANAAGNACDNTNDWSQGWIVASAKTGCSANSLSGTPVQRTAGISAKYTTNYSTSNVAASPRTWLCFNRMGVAQTGYTGTFVLDIVEGSSPYKRCVVVTAAGAVQALRDGQTDSVSGESCS